MSQQSSASATLLWMLSHSAVPLPVLRLKGNSFTKLRFNNSTLGTIPYRRSASTTPLRREFLNEVPLPQLPLEGNFFTKFRFHNSARRGISYTPDRELRCFTLCKKFVISHRLSHTGASLVVLLFYSICGNYFEMSHHKRFPMYKLNFITFRSNFV